MGAHIAAVGEAAGGLDAALQQAARDEVQAQAAAGRRDRADLAHHAVHHLLHSVRPCKHLRLYETAFRSQHSKNLPYSFRCPAQLQISCQINVLAWLGLHVAAPQVAEAF